MERISAHKAMLAKSSTVFEEVIYKDGGMSELEMEAVGGWLN